MLNKAFSVASFEKQEVNSAAAAGVDGDIEGAWTIRTC